jgi:glycosyltransferase involved in cell wall biosynthesis
MGATMGRAVTTSGRLHVLHVVVQAGPANSQWNEHCLPAADRHVITVCSLLPSTVAPDPRIRRYDGTGSRLGALRVLRSALRGGEYDVVHVHAPSSAALLLGAAALGRRRVDDVVLTLHNSWPNFRPRNRLLAVLVMAVVPTTVACSSSAAASVPRWVRRLARRPMQVVTNGVDVERVERAGEEHHLRPSNGAGRTVVSVGRMIPIKDQATLLTAFASASRPHDRLVVLGDGPLRAELEQLAGRLGVAERVELPGLLPRDEVYRLLGRADAYVSTSRGEGLPLSVLEALAARLPAVLSDIPPHREVAAATAAARLVPVGDARAFADALSRLLALPPEQRAALGRSARKAVTDAFSVHSMTDGYARIYAALRRGDRQPIGAAA